MRVKYVQTNNRQKAIEICPWAAYMKKMASGFMMFESYDDYLTHENQK